MLTPHLTETYSQNEIPMEDITIQRLQEGTPLSYTDREAILKMYNDGQYKTPVEQPQQSPVKTLQECKDEVAKKYGFNNWFDLDYHYRQNDYRIVINREVEAEEMQRSQPVPVTEGREWVSVKDRLPENEQRIICLSKENRVKDRMYFDGDEVHFRDHFLGWMPLPSPPTH